MPRYPRAGGGTPSAPPICWAVESSPERTPASASRVFVSTNPSNGATSNPSPKPVTTIAGRLLAGRSLPVKASDRVLVELTAGPAGSRYVLG